MQARLRRSACIFFVEANYTVINVKYLYGFLRFTGLSPFCAFRACAFLRTRFISSSDFLKDF